jgi:hypothetical protein
MTAAITANRHAIALAMTQSGLRTGSGAAASSSFAAAGVSVVVSDAAVGRATVEELVGDLTGRSSAAYRAGSVASGFTLAYVMLLLPLATHCRQSQEKA